MKFIFMAFCLLFSTLLDTQLKVPFLNTQWPLQISFVYLVYLFIKRDFSEAVWGLFLFALLAHAMGSMGLFEIILPYSILLIMVRYTQNRILSETYLFEAIWAMGLFFVFLCLQYWLLDPETFFTFRLYKSLKLIYYALFHGVLAFATFIFLDNFYDLYFKRKKSY